MKIKFFTNAVNAKGKNIYISCIDDKYLCDVNEENYLKLLKEGWVWKW